ncbi:DoxX family membrane protein [Patescibacteria group bacterium]|nr:MAG: DoxX family membrane protein [Patescibacteria group bacterium]
MKKISFLILRIGLAIVFIWIGISILKNPEAWGAFLKPWALALLPIPLKEAMLGTAILDLVIGGLLLSNTLIWLAALLGSIHLLVVLITSGIDDVTVRDIGLLAATLALFIEFLPDRLIPKTETQRELSQNL